MDDEMKPMPREFNIPLTDEHISKTEQSVAPMLLSLIETEMRHVLKNDTIHRPVDTSEHRAVCDFCASTIFAGFWFCTKCGRDYCLQCERYFSDTKEALLDSPWPINDAARTRLQKCSRGETLPLTSTKAGKHIHSRDNLQATSRFSKEEMKLNWTALVKFVLEPSTSGDIDQRIKSLGIADDVELSKAVTSWLESRKGDGKDAVAQKHLTDEELKALYDASKDLPRVDDPAALDTHPFMYVRGDRLDDDLFDQLWARGEPLVVHDIGHKLNMDWTPDYFIERFGRDPCFVLDCQKEQVESMLTGQFFSLLKDPSRTAQYAPPSRLEKVRVREAVPIEDDKCSDAGSNKENTPGRDHETNGSLDKSVQKDAAVEGAEPPKKLKKERRILKLKVNSSVLFVAYRRTGRLRTTFRQLTPTSTKTFVARCLYQTILAARAF